MIKTAIIKNNLFTMRTQGCEVQIITKKDNRYLVKVLKQPNIHKKALPVGKIITVHEIDLIF